MREAPLAGNLDNFGRLLGEGWTIKKRFRAKFPRLHKEAFATSLCRSNDGLGSNTTLRLPLTRYKYLRVTLDGPVKPSAVETATAEVREEEKEVWRTVSSQPRQEQQG